MKLFFDSMSPLLYLYVRQFSFTVLLFCKFCSDWIEHPEILSRIQVLKDTEKHIPWALEYNQVPMAHPLFKM